MAANWETNEALKNANAQVQAGIDGKDSAQVAAGMAAQQQALGDMGIVMPTMEGRNAAIKEAGGVVPSGGSVSYAAAAGGKGGRSQGMVDELKGLYGANSDYAWALAQMRAANDAAVQQTIGELTAQKAKTNQSYADMFRQLYIQRKNAQKNMGQRLAAQGINGGAAESSMLELETGYSEALRQGEQERINAQNELDRAISEARLTGKIQNAQATLDGVREQTAGYAGVLQGLLNRQDSWDMHDETTEKNDSYARAQLLGQAGNFSGYQSLYGLTDEEMTSLQEGYDKGDKQAVAQILAQAGDYSGYRELLGLTPEQVAKLEANHNSGKALSVADLMAQAGDFSGYKTALGLTDEQVATLEAWYKKQNAPKVSYSGSETPRQTMQMSDVEAWVNAYGEDAAADYIGEHYKALGYSSKSAALSAWNNYKWQNGLSNDGTWGGVEAITRGTRGNAGNGGFRWNGRVYSSVDDMISAFVASNPSAYAVRQMNAYLKSVGSGYELAYE